MIIYDFFAGTGSATKAFEDAGHEVIKVELDESFDAHERNVLDLTPEYLIEKYGHFDFIWASPPCTTFSVASIPYYWPNGEPTEKALKGIELVEHTIELIRLLKPKLGWLIENPRGMLRKQSFMLNLPRETITYCQYGFDRMKPTDLWGYVPNWKPRPMCKNGSNCHDAAPRGSKTGTQGLKGAYERGALPFELCKEIVGALK